LRTHSIPAEQIAGPAAHVFDQLVRAAAGLAYRKEISWELRIVQGSAGNAFSLPDGAIYVDSEMAQAIGGEPGLWAALLSHEIVHVVRQHWVARSTFKDSLRDLRTSWSLLGIGAPLRAVTSSAQENQADLDALSQDLELDADARSLDLMVRAGFHPDFVIALHHLMETRESDLSPTARSSLTHPQWDKREANLRNKQYAAVAEFSKHWPSALDSPGGNPPALAFLERPQINFAADRKNAQLRLPLRCENFSGEVKVVLLIRRLPAQAGGTPGQPSQVQQTTQCASNGSIVSFVLNPERPREELDAEFYAMDGRGWILARSQHLRVRY
jgi:Peptidase family M48